MAGQIKKALDAIITARAKGNAAVVNTTKTKLLLKGIDYDKFNALSADDAATLATLRTFAKEMNLELKI